MRQNTTSYECATQPRHTAKTQQATDFFASGPYARGMTTNLTLPALLDAAQLPYGQGAIFGALVGDAAGSALEFLGHPPTSAEVADAMRMVGSRIFSTAPGQITDDGEMTLALLQALTGQVRFAENKVAHAYRAWYLSDPFDVGFATSNALDEGELDDPHLAQLLYRNAAVHNSASQANGCLMRASALGVWATRISAEAAVDAARHDARLTHPHPFCQWACAAYVLAIRHLVKHPGDNLGALDQVANLLRHHPEAPAEVAAWLEQARAQAWPACQPNIGHVKIAFIHAFAHLASNSPYETALAEVLRGGGDTDTNACITGGLIGACQGIDAIPPSQRQALLTCDTGQGRHRPAWLRTQGLEKMVTALMSGPLTA